MSNRKSIHYFMTWQLLLLLLVALVILEFGSRGVLYYMIGVEENSYAHYYRNDPKLRMITWTEGFSPHPYFGYESPTTRSSEKILMEATSEDFVIGILGGSVAGSFAEYSIGNSNH